MEQGTTAGFAADPRVDRAGALPRCGLAIHAVLLGAVLLACLFLPRPGQAILLIPIGPSAGLPLRAELSGGGLALLGQGRISGTWLVQASGPLPVRALLAHRLLPLAAPPFLCGAGVAPIPSDTPRGQHG